MRIHLFLILCLFLISCSDEEGNCFKSYGERVEMVSEVDAFHSINLYDNLPLKISEGINFEITIKHGSNLIDGIDFTVKDSVLTLDNLNKCRWLKNQENTPEISISCPLDILRRIQCYGVGDVSVLDTIRSKQFFIDHWGSVGNTSLLFSGESLHLSHHAGPGSIIARGKTSVLYVYNTSTGYTDASQVESGFLFCTSRTNRTINAGASVRADLKLYGSGDVELCPSPAELNLVEKGSGRVVLCK
ncbi:GIN domain-containing protein [Luteibaculum oceani]|uniref:Putative auto-transporter adhesin head GIN domain-containing protein n=1 Tax=Luteibaculum oceani TaxID=1294296 RepID=A0A5C6V4D2_9FLAO|nr:DUF2807 domain-containing protein [Luteibaculum oceani]TXC78588.1 hypothetical protein FRX97_07680 [Luteibaculum oceani]